MKSTCIEGLYVKTENRENEMNRATRIERAKHG